MESLHLDRKSSFFLSRQVLALPVKETDIARGLVMCRVESQSTPRRTIPSEISSWLPGTYSRVSKIKHFERDLVYTGPTIAFRVSPF